MTDQREGLNRHAWWPQVAGPVRAVLVVIEGFTHRELVGWDTGVPQRCPVKMGPPSL